MSLAIRDDRSACTVRRENFANIFPYTTMPRPLDARSLMGGWPLALYSIASLAAVVGMLYKAGIEQPDAYLASVWISMSNGCVAITLNAILCTYLLVGRITQVLLFGPLRINEAEQLSELLTFVAFDFCLTMTIFLPSFDMRYMLLASTVTYVAILRELCGFRIESIGQMVAFPRFFFIRMGALFSYLMSAYVVLVPFVVLTLIQTPGPGGLVILVVADVISGSLDLLAKFAKYTCALYDHGREEPWDEKSRYIFFIELIQEVLTFATYPLTYLIVIYKFTWNMGSISLTLPFSAIRSMTLLGFSIFKKLRVLYLYRAATYNMDQKYPRLSSDELAVLSDPTCIICREELSAVNDQRYIARRLACGHVFHHRCLQSWLERQQSCPTCRHNVLEASPAEPERHMEPVPPAPVVNAPGAATDGTLQGLLARFAPNQEVSQSTPADVARSFLRQVNPQLLGQVQDIPQLHGDEPVPSATEGVDGIKPKPESATDVTPTEPEEPREAVRRAALQRFASVYTPQTPPSVPESSRSTDHTTSPILIPLFDPSSVPHFATEIQPQLPHPLAPWIHSATSNESLSRLDPDSLKRSVDAQLRERLRLLQDTERVLQNTISQLSAALKSDHPITTEE